MQGISTSSSLLFLLLVAFALAACGNKGDLYLPPKQQDTPAGEEKPAANKPPPTDETGHQITDSLSDSPPA